MSNFTTKLSTAKAFANIKNRVYFSLIQFLIRQLKRKKNIMNCLSGKVTEFSDNIKDKISSVSISEILSNFKYKILSYIPIDSFKESIDNTLNDAKDIWNSVDVKGTLTKPKVVEVLNWCMIFILSYITWRILRLLYHFFRYIAKAFEPFKSVLQQLIENILNRILGVLKKWLAILKKHNTSKNEDGTSHRNQVQLDGTVEGLIFKDQDHSESLRRFEEKQEKEERYYNYYRCYGCNEKWETATVGKGPVEMCRKANCNYLFGPYHEILLLNNKEMKEKFDSTRQDQGQGR